MSVVPDRGSPTMNTGSSLSNPKPRTRPKNSGVQTAIIWVTKRLVLFRVVLLAALAPFGPLQRVAPIEVLGGLGILAPRVQDFGQAEVQRQSLCVRQLRFLQQPALRSQIVLRKFAAQEFRQFVMREGEAGDCAATRRGRSVPRPGDRPSPPGRCPGCCAPRQSPASVPVPGGSRRPLRPVSPGPSAHCPGCCAPRRSRRFSSSARR